MGRKYQVTDYYVRVDPVSSMFARTEQERLKIAQSTCTSIARAIERHVDDIARTSLESDGEYVCEFCGEPWTERPNAPHNGGCCIKDGEMMEQAGEHLTEADWVILRQQAARHTETK